MTFFGINKDVQVFASKADDAIKELSLMARMSLILSEGSWEGAKTPLGESDGELDELSKLKLVNGSGQLTWAGAIVRERICVLNRARGIS